MNIKKLIFRIIAFIIITNAQVVYTKESQDDNNNSRISITSQENDILQNNAQYNEEIWKFIEETFQTVTDQTQKIEFCLQTIEQIVNAGKIKFDDQKISKAQLLQEIKEIKVIIQMISDFYMKQLPKDDGIMRGTCFNIAFIDYLLPVFQNDITKINANDFDSSVAKKYDLLMNELQDPAQLSKMITDNEENLKSLINASDNVGLSMLNKMYRYLDTKQLPWYGKSTIATMQDVARWGAAGLIVYGATIFFMPREFAIPGTWKEYIAKTKIAAPDKESLRALKVWQDNNSEKIDDKTIFTADVPQELKEIDDYVKSYNAKNQNIQNEIVTWTDNGKTYTRWTANDLPLKSFFGDLSETERSLIQQDGIEAKNLQKNYGVYSYLYIGARKTTDPFFLTLLGSAGIAAWLVKKDLLDAYEATKKRFNEGINYYLKGDITPLKDSNYIQKTYFKDIIGGEELEQRARHLTDYLKNPTRYERAGNPPPTGYLLVGPSQTGKTFFAKALKTMVDEAFEGATEAVKYWEIRGDDLKYNSIDDIFYAASKNAPIILFIDEIDMYGTRRDKDRDNTRDLLTCINGLNTDPSKKVIVIAATNKPEELDFALKQKGRLGEIITFDYPTYECRKQYLEKQLNKINVNLGQDIIESIAQETENQTYNMIDDIIRKSMSFAMFQNRTARESDFEATLDREIRKIKLTTNLSTQEKELVAIYQAGQATARHILATDQQIVKITVNMVDKQIKSKEGFAVINEQKGQEHENHELLPQVRMKQTRLGFVFTMSKTNNHELLSDHDQEKELMALIAGQAALELIKGKTFNGFGKEDRAKILEALEKKISQGTPITDKIRQQAIAAKDALYLKAKNALQNHIPFIRIIADELIKNNTINTKQWIELSTNYKI